MTHLELYENLSQLVIAIDNYLDEKTETNLDLLEKELAFAKTELAYHEAEIIKWENENASD